MAPLPLHRLAAVILTGGTGSRLGGLDKASVEVGGQTLLERALAATSAADEVVVVGARVPTSSPVTWTREEPPGGGPAAGLLSGLRALGAAPELVCVLAVDMAAFTSATLERLVDRITDEDDAACLVDDDGRSQWLAAVYRYDALLAAAPTERAAEHGLAMRRLVLPLRVAGLPARGDEARDADTWEDLRYLRERQ